VVRHTVGNRMSVVGGLLLVGVLVLPSIATAEAKSIGNVKTVNDHAFITRGEERLPGHVGDLVFQHDVLETDEKGSLGVTLKDNTRISLGPQSRLALIEFVFNPKDEEYSFVSEIMRGTLVYLSGMMAKLSPESVSIKTPTATVGIRGTKLIIKILDEDEETPNDEKVSADEVR